MQSQSNPWYLRFFERKTPEMWHRWLPIWHGAFFVFFGVATIFMMLFDSQAYTVPQWGILHVAFVLWYGVCMRYDVSYWRDHQVRFAIYITIGWGLWWLLINGSSIYSLVLSGLFPQIFIFFNFRNAIIATVALNGIILLRMYQYFPNAVNSWLLVILMTSAGGIILGYFINDIIRQSYERWGLIEELNETRAQLAIAERFAGIAQERERIAADLHDTLVQSLISVVTHLEAAEISNSSDNPHLQTAKQAARDSLHEARLVIWDLQSPANDLQAFCSLLEDECAKWTQRTGLKIAFTEAGDTLILSDERQHVLLRVLQEALSNISRHAKAIQIFVTLKCKADTIQLIIADDGQGFDIDKAKLGNGLTNMRQRIESVSGTFVVESSSGAGTVVKVTFCHKGGE